MLINITKKLVIVFVIGILIGAIIATAGFLIFGKFSKCDSDRPAPPSFSQSENSGMPGMPGSSGETGKENSGKSGKPSKAESSSESKGEQPPEKPEGNESGISEKPDESN